jgi:hypothetical protein
MYLDTIGEAVILAAEQIQDKRLELIETPESLSILEEVFGYLIDLALDKIAGPLITAGAKALLGKVLRFRAAFVSRQDLKRTKLTVEVVKGRMTAQPLVPTAKSIGRKDTEEWELFQKIAVAAAGGAKKSTEEATRAKEKFARLASDSISVAFIDTVQMNLLQQKAATRRIHDELALAVQNDAIEADALTEAREFLQSNVEGDIDLYELKTHMRLLYEAAIWSLLVNPERIRSTKTIIHSSVEAATIEEPYYGYRDDLVKYWIERFPHPGYRDYRTSFKDRYPRGHEDDAVVALIKYFREIRGATGGLELLELIKKRFGPKVVEKMVQKVLGLIKSPKDLLRLLTGR